MTLKEQVKTYLELKQQKEAIEKQLKKLNSDIVEELSSKGKTTFLEDGYSAKVTYKVGFKYNDEVALIELLKASEDTKKYVIETIDSKGLNALIKSSESVAKRLNESYTKTTTSSLTVEKV